MDQPGLHILKLEEALLDPAVRRDAARLHALLAPDFVEFGASGRVLDRAAIVESLARETPVRRALTDFAARSLAPDLILATYRIARLDAAGSRAGGSLRSSLWARREQGWQLLFHQGTPEPA